MDIVLRDSDIEIKKLAVEKISDPQVLFEIAKLTSVEEIALIVVSKIEDQDNLVWIVGNSWSDKLKTLALVRIKDASVLFGIVKNPNISKEYRVRAVSYIGDRMILGQILILESMLPSEVKTTALKMLPHSDSTVHYLANSGTSLGMEAREKIADRDRSWKRDGGISEAECIRIGGRIEIISSTDKRCYK